MNRRQHKKALKKAFESGNPVKIHALTHKTFLRNLRDNIKGYKDLINADLPNCSPKVQEVLERTADKKEGIEKEGTERE